eukprot:COSAG04_NODE_23481_length_337_cov_1.512605_1_plen_41_part_01
MLGSEKEHSSLSAPEKDNHSASGQRGIGASGHRERLGSDEP